MEASSLIKTLTALIVLTGGVWGGVEFMDSRYVAAAELKSLSVEIFYREYFDAEDKLRAAQARGDAQAVKDQTRRLERLKAKICEMESTWERCKE